MSKITPPRKLCAIIGIGLGILNPLFAQNKVDLGNLATKNANGIKYIAVGSSLSAGVRDGGVYAEAQQTSFPALLAQQMGIEEFKQPLLDGNGTGKKTASMDKNGILKFTETPATYNDKKKEIKLPKVTTEIDNLAVPYLKAGYIDVEENKQGGFLTTFDTKSYKHQNRFNEDKQNNETGSYINLVQNKIKVVDFFTMEIGFDDFMSYYTNGGYGQSMSLLVLPRENYYPEINLIDVLQNKGAKGVLSNVPDLLKFPYFSDFTFKSLSDKLGNGTNLYVERYGKNDTRLIDKRDILLPTPSLIDLLNGVTTKGRTFEQPLLDEEIIGIEEQLSVDNYNNSIKFVAEMTNLPLVDLKGLYDKVLIGNYVTDDGILVLPHFPNGNFFSSDGITPTAFGQAIIANEFIKTINSYYKSNVPLLKTATYLK